MQSPMELPSSSNTPQPSSHGAVNTIPGPKGRFLLGNLPDIPFDQFHEYLKEQSKQYGDVFKLSLANKTMVVLSNPETVRTILKQRPNTFRRISAMQDVFGELGINGVFSAEGDEWKIQRKMMNQAFKASQIHHYYPIISNTTNRLTSSLNALSEQHKAFDFQALMMRYTIDITTQLAFGYDVNSLENQDSELQKKLSIVFPMISYRVKAPIPYWRYFKLKKDKELDAALSFIREQCHQYIKDAEAKVKAQGNPSNILESMIMARDEEDIPFSQDQLFANIITLLLAGEDTTANTLSWVMHYLTKHPQYQSQLQQEIDNSTLDFSDIKNLDQLPMLSAVIQEAMRLMPVAPFLYIENLADQTIEGYDIPAGTMLTLLTSQSGHDDEIFSQSDEFRPERWLKMTEETQKQRTKDLMHFGNGPRLCPGMQLSFIEMKYALITMLKQFNFIADNNSQTKAQFAFTVMPEGLNVTVKERK